MLLSVFLPAVAPVLFFVCIAVVAVVAGAFLGIDGTDQPLASDGSRVREDLDRRLPLWCQPLVSLVTGAVRPSDKPFIAWTRAGLYIACIGLFALGVLLSAAAFVAGPMGGVMGLFLLGLGQLLTVGGARSIMTTVLHDCVHSLAKERGRYGRSHLGPYYWLGTILAFILQTQRFEDYYTEHLTHHRQTVFGRPADPDYEFLLSLGFQPGQTLFQYWVHFLTLLFSPWFHLRFFFSRLWSRAKSPQSFYSSVIYWVLLLWLGAHVGWGLLAAVWLIPLFVLLNAAALFQFTGEHRWGKLRDPQKARVQQESLLTSARYCGDVPPRENLPFPRRLLAWMAWWFRLLTVHLVCRVAVLPFELIHHDLHHHAAWERVGKRRVDMPRFFNWMNSAHSRADYVKNRAPSDPACTEFWGVGNAIDSTFRTWTVLPARSPTTGIHPNALPAT